MRCLGVILFTFLVKSICLFLPNDGIHSIDTHMGQTNDEKPRVLSLCIRNILHEKPWNRLPSEALCKLWFFFVDYTNKEKWLLFCSSDPRDAHRWPWASINAFWHFPTSMVHEVFHLDKRQLVVTMFLLHEHSPNNQLSFSHRSPIHIYTLTSPKGLCQISFTECLAQNVPYPYLSKSPGLMSSQ